MFSLSLYPFQIPHTSPPIWIHAFSVSYKKANKHLRNNKIKINNTQIGMIQQLSKKKSQRKMVKRTSYRCRDTHLYTRYLIKNAEL